MSERYDPSTLPALIIVCGICGGRRGQFDVHDPDACRTQAAKLRDPSHEHEWMVPDFIACCSCGVTAQVVLDAPPSGDDEGAPVAEALAILRHFEPGEPTWFHDFKERVIAALDPCRRGEGSDAPTDHGRGVGRRGR